MNRLHPSLIMKLPTLFAIIRRLKEKAVAIIYISHRMAEIKAIADKVSILKDGTYQGTFPVATTTVETIVAKMVGRNCNRHNIFPTRKKLLLLEVKNLSGDGFYNISFTLHEGEILGIAGLQGSGRTTRCFGPFRRCKIQIRKGIQGLV
jgi:ribose transport system ATP-binding protein